MRKIFALYHNEMIKISRKVSIIVLLILMVVGVFGFGGIFKLQSVLSQNNSYYYNNDEWAMERIKEELTTQKAEYAELEKQLAAATDPMEQMTIQDKMDSIKPLIEVQEIALEKNIPYNYNDGAGLQGLALQQLQGYLSSLQTHRRAYAQEPTDKNQKLVKTYEDLSARMKAVVDSKDYKEYISICNDAINADSSYSAEEKKILLESNELRLKSNPTGENVGQYSYGYGVEGQLNQIETAKRSLLYNIDYSSQQTNKPLSAEQRKEVQNQLAVAEYKLEHGLYIQSNRGMPDVSSSAVPSMISIGGIIIVLMILILAGGSVSQEMSTGSIKSLIISPTKRWKIFTAKLMSLITVGVVASLLMYGAVLLANLVFFGTSTVTPYIYAVDGVAHELNFFVYQLAYVFVNYIDVFVYMVFAFMLSIVTRNSAASVGISIGLYFGGNILMQVLAMVGKGEWVKFVPFNNMSLTGKFFPYSSLNDMAMGMGVSTAAQSTLSFSLIYLAVMVFCMGYIAFDSFTRRDIK